jgi:hypothetical protein
MIESKKNMTEFSKESYSSKRALLLIVMMVMLILLQIVYFHVISHDLFSIPSQHMYKIITTLEMPLLVF